MKTILIIVLIVLVIYIFWPKNKKPATPITKSRALEGIEDLDEEKTDTVKDSRRIPDKYLYPKERAGSKAGFFYGKKVCVSGEFDHYPEPSKLVEELWGAGAIILSCADASCDILVCGDEVSPKKLENAEEHGMQIIYEEELVEKLNQSKNQTNE